MTRPFPTRVFLDGGNPVETQSALMLLGFLDGQTTNPSLIAKNPIIQEYIKENGTLASDGLLDAYKKIGQDIHVIIPDGAISLEAYADKDTTAEDMITQAHILVTWLPAPYIKLPITHEGLRAAEILVKEGMRINMTLCFSQEQALAVHYATQGAEPGQVFVSPFIGRLDDKDVCGMSVIENILEQYRERKSHVQVLGASIRSVDHIYACLQKDIDSMTIPFNVIEKFISHGFAVPENFSYQCSDNNLESIPYTAHASEKWEEYNIQHDLTDTGLQKFADDWNALLK